MNKQLMEQGYLKLEPFDENKCDSIVEQIGQMEFQSWHGYHTVQGYDFKAANSNIYQVKDHKVILAIPEVKEMCENIQMLKLVSQYLGGTPIQTQCNCWWTINHNEAEGGQKFHQDSTYSKFIKGYLYLNDVTMENGPHVYVPGSVHNMIHPEPYRAHQRVTDEFIEENYSDIIYLTGEKGSIHLVDTNGWHKGLPVISGHRLIIQLEWTLDTTDLKSGKETIYL